jgi:hypothetical protein
MHFGCVGLSSSGQRFRAPLRPTLAAIRPRQPAPRRAMRDVSRHKSMNVLQAYVRDAGMFPDHVGAG